MADMTDPRPDTPSSAYARMASLWTMIDDILAGADAIRAAGERYLPKYEGESREEYKRRLETAPWRSEFADALRGLASKPFGKEVALQGQVSANLKTIAEDVDGRGHNLHVFAGEVFDRGVAKGMGAILVDYPSMAPGATLADERQSGARPYWVHVRAEDILALYTTWVGRREIVSHVRIRELHVERDGFGEKAANRVRVLELAPESDEAAAAIKPRWQLWEERKSPGAKDGKTWEKIGEGPITLPEIPLALFFTGEREGAQFVRPPLRDLAHMQIELYQATSRKEEILTFAGAPMLSAKGLAPPADGEVKIEVGPKRVLFAPPALDGGQTGWEFVQPAAANIKEIRDDVAGIVDDMRRLGMQPMTQRSGTVTATATSVEAAKAHSAVEAWAVALKDALEQAFVFTAMWLAEPATAEVFVDTDFSVATLESAPLDALAKARAAKDISRKTYVDELRRRDVLGPQFDRDADEEALAEEMADLEPEEAIDPATGQPIGQAAAS